MFGGFGITSVTDMRSPIFYMSSKILKYSLMILNRVLNDHLPLVVSTSEVENVLPKQVFCAQFYKLTDIIF